VNSKYASAALVLIVSAFLVAYAFGDPSEEVRAQAIQLVGSDLESDDVFHSIERVPDRTAGRANHDQYWVRFCSTDEQGGGRQFRISGRDNSWTIIDSSRWVESEKANPANQVRIGVPISIDRARAIVSIVEPRVQDVEWLSIIRSHEKLVEVPEDERPELQEPEPGQLARMVSHRFEVAENVFEITTIRKDDISGRVFVVYADSLHAMVQQINRWWF